MDIGDRFRDTPPQLISDADVIARHRRFRGFRGFRGFRLSQGVQGLPGGVQQEKNRTWVKPSGTRFGMILYIYAYVYIYIYISIYLSIYLSI